MTITSLGGSSGLQAMQQLLFKALDKDQSGQISSDEFSVLGQSTPTGARQSEHRGAANASDRFGSNTLESLMSAQIQDRFNTSDSNGDGKLSAAEIAAGMTADGVLGAKGDASAMAARFLKDGDSNGDGSISADEFKAAVPKGRHGPGGPPGADGPPPPPPPAQADSGGSKAAGKAENPADKNGDGVVSASELLAYLQGATSQASSGLSSDAADLMKSLLSQLDALGGSTGSNAKTAGVTA